MRSTSGGLADRGTSRPFPLARRFSFKLHSPLNFIVGGGFLVSHSNIPISLAWDAFGEKNGAESIESVRGLIETYRRDKPMEHDPVIGCTILANPFFLERSEWIPSPSDWGRGIMTGKTYDTASATGEALWTEVRTQIAGSRSERHLCLPVHRFIGRVDSLRI